MEKVLKLNPDTATATEPVVNIVGNNEMTVEVEEPNIIPLSSLLEPGEHDVNTRRYGDKTPLIEECKSKYGKLQNVISLLKHGASIDLADEWSRTALIHACDEGNESIAMYLVEQGASLEAMDDNKKTPLIIACDKNLESVVALMLEKGADANHEDKTDRTPLEYACYGDSVSIATLLLEIGADVNVGAASGYSLLNVMCKKGNEQMAVLLMNYGASLQDKYDNGKTAFLTACQKNLKDAVALMLCRGEDGNQTDNLGLTGLMLASKNKSPPLILIQLLIDHGVAVELKDNYGMTAFLHACDSHTLEGEEYGEELDTYGSNSVSVVSFLVEMGASIEARDDDRKTSLMYACQGGNVDLVEFLLSKGANVNDVDGYGMTALAYARREEIWNVLMENGASLEWKDRFGRTALHYACKQALVSVVKTLLIKGVDVHAKDTMNTTVLMYACEANGGDQCVDLIISSGGRVNEKDDLGKTPLMYAIDRKSDSTLHLHRNVQKGQTIKEDMTSVEAHDSMDGFGSMEKIIANGGCVNDKDNFGKTPLTYAVEKRPEQFATILIENNASLDDLDNQYQTPLMYACKRNVGLVKLLLEKGANVNNKDCDYKTPLMYGSWCEDISQCLLDKGASLFGKIEDTGMSLFLVACKFAFSGFVTMALKQGVDVNEKDRNGKTALMYACERHAKDVYSILIYYDANKDLQDINGKTALMYALQNHSDFINIDFIYSNYLSNVKFKDANRMNALMYACKGRCFQAAKYILKWKVKLQNDVGVNDMDNHEKTALVYAYEADSRSIVNHLIEHGASPDSGEATDFLEGKKKFNTGSSNTGTLISSVKLLIEKHTNLIATDLDLKQALHLAVVEDDILCCEHILVRLAQVYTKKHCWFIDTEHTCLSRHQDVVNIVKEICQNETSKQYVDIQSSGHKHIKGFLKEIKIMFAWSDRNKVLKPMCSRGSLRTMKLLNRLGVYDPGFNDAQLIIACEHDQERVVEWLVQDVGVDFKGVDDYSKFDYIYDYEYTALSAACEYDCRSCVEILLKAGAQIKYDEDCKILRYGNPLSMAKGNHHLVRLLFQHDKDAISYKELENRTGMTFFHKAVSQCNHQCMDIYIQAGQDIDSVFQRHYKVNTLSVALEKGCETCVNILIESGQVMSENKFKHNFCKSIGSKGLLYAAKFGIFDWRMCDAENTIVGFAPYAMTLGLSPGGNSIHCYNQGDESDSTIPISPLVSVFKKLCLQNETDNPNARKGDVIESVDMNEWETIDYSFQRYTYKEIFQMIINRLYFFAEDFHNLKALVNKSEILNNQFDHHNLIPDVLTLRALSFLTVSKSISLSGSPHERASKVNELPLPNALKQRLMFIPMKTIF